MKPLAYFQDRVRIFLGYLPDKALNAGIDVVSTIIVYHMAPMTIRTRLRHGCKDATTYSRAA